MSNALGIAHGRLAQELAAVMIARRTQDGSRLAG